MPQRQPSVRLPLVTHMESRDSYTNKDAKMVNCFIEKQEGGPIAVKRPGVTQAFQGKVGGGQGITNFLDTIYSVSGDTVCTSGTGGAPLPFKKQVNSAPFSARYGHGVVAFRNRLWVMGGISSSETTLGDVYESTDGINWTIATAAAPWGPRSDMGLVVFNGVLYLIGGRNGATYYGDVWSTADGLTWTQLTASGFGPRCNHGVCVFQNKMWIAGGYGSNNKNAYNDLYYSSDGANWFKPAGQSTAPWAARAKFAFGAINGKLVVCGGDLSYDLPNAAGDFWSSADGSTWTRITANPFAQPATLLASQLSWQSDGQEYSVAPALSFTGGSGSGAAATAYLDTQDADTSTIILAQVTNQGSGYTDAPTVVVAQDGTSIQAGFLAYLLATNTAGDKRGFTVFDSVNQVLYFIADENFGSDNNPTEIWKTTDGATWSLVTPAPTWSTRQTSGTFDNGFWIIGGKNTQNAIYYNDVWGAGLATLGTGGLTALPTPTEAGLRFTFNQTSRSITQPKLFLKSSKDGYVYNPIGSVMTKITNANYPAATVPGIAYLDGSFYVMTPSGQIYGSAINDPTNWTALNMVAMQSEPNAGMALAKYANYILALGEWSLEYFYDNNNPAPASPLSTNSSLTSNVGCANGDSMVEMQNTVLWIGQTKDAGRAIYMIDNLAPLKISTPYVDRILQSADVSTVYAYATTAEGHNFYVLSLANNDMTLVFDFTTREWYEWTARTNVTSKPVTSVASDAYGTVTAVCVNHGLSDGDPFLMAGASDDLFNGYQNAAVIDLNTFTYKVNGVPAANTSNIITMTPSVESFFYGSAGAGANGVYYIQHYSTGMVYKLDVGAYTDDSAPLDVRVKTPIWDGGMKHYKGFPDVTLIADIAAARALLRYSDDDYNSWSGYRSIDMSQPRQHATRLGRARRRAYEVRFTANAPMRFKAIEFTPDAGEF